MMATRFLVRGLLKGAIVAALCSMTLLSTPVLAGSGSEAPSFELPERFSVSVSRGRVVDDRAGATAALPLATGYSGPNVGMVGGAIITGCILVAVVAATISSNT